MNRGCPVADVTIYTSRTCGWAVRNYAALIEKGVEFETVPAADSDGGKLDEFLALTPYGKTPVMSHGNTAVFESTLINEYIDEQFPEPALMPGDAARRCEARKWIHYCESKLLPALTTIAQAIDDDNRDRAADRFDEDLRWFERSALLATWRGPYFFGGQFSLVDLSFFTLFRTIDDLERHLDLNLSMPHPALRNWANNIQARPSLQRAQAIQEGLGF